MSKKRRASAPAVALAVLEPPPIITRPVDVELIPLGPNTRATYRRSRIHDPVYNWWRKCEITDAQWQACEHFRDDLALAEGASQKEPWQQSGGGFTGRSISDARLDAETRLRAYWRVIGIIASPVVVHVLIQLRPMGEIEKALGWWDPRGKKTLIAALDRMADVGRPRGGRE